SFFSLRGRHPLSSTLFPYTTLFRSRLRDPARPELLDVIDDDVVKESAPNVRVPAGALDQIVLEVSVLGTDYPTSVERIVRRCLLLEHVSGDANARAIACRHPEGEIGPLEVELVGRFGGTLVSAVLK